MNGNGKSPEDYQIEDFVADETFINYFFRLNADDIAFWEKWLLSHPDNMELVEAAKEMLRNLSLTLSDEEFEAEMARIRKAIYYEAPLSANRKPVIARLLHWEKSSRTLKDKKRSYKKYFLPLLLALVVGGYFFMKQFATHADEFIEKHNDSDKPVVLTLTDGTVVTLAPQSAFRYPADFGNKERKVYLNGEAQFHVSRDEGHPFKVYEGDIIATVLGTIFNIKKQSGDSTVMVELIKGKLKVEAVNNAGLSLQSIILNPDERVVYKRYSQNLYKEKWQSQNDVPVQVNHLVFKKNNFEEIAKQLKTVFGVTVINQSNKKPWRFTGEFNNTSAIDVLESICIVEKLKYEVEGDTIFIK
jgi:transmembrane sensor